MQTKSTTNITAGSSGMLDVSNPAVTHGPSRSHVVEALS